MGRPYGAGVDPVDAVGVLADLHVRALLLEQRGLDEDQIAIHLGLPSSAVPGLLRIARAKLAAVERGDGT